MLKRSLQIGLAVFIGMNVWVVAGTFRDTIRFHSERAAECSWADVLRCRHEGLNPIAPNIQKAVKVVGSDANQRLLTTPLGSFWVGAKDLQTLSVMITEQQEGIYEIDGHGVHAGDIVLDCGANIGVYTRHALALGAKQVIAIEPSPDTLEFLRRNLAPDIASGKVVVYPKGVWNEPGELKLYHGYYSWSDSLVEVDRSDPTPVRVALTTIDLLVHELKLERVDFIKMDIEGAERQALEGARDTVNRFHPRMAVALEHLKGEAEELPQLIRQIWPEMRTKCGPCSMQLPSGKYRVQPQVVAAY